MFSDEASKVMIFFVLTGSKFPMGCVSKDYEFALIITLLHHFFSFVPLHYIFMAATIHCGGRRRLVGLFVKVSFDLCWGQLRVYFFLFCNIPAWSANYCSLFENQVSARWFSVSFINIFYLAYMQFQTEAFTHPRSMYASNIQALMI